LVGVSPRAADARRALTSRLSTGAPPLLPVATEQATKGTTAGVRVDALASRLYLAAPGRGEIAVDVRPSQLAGLVAAFGDCNEGGFGPETDRQRAAPTDMEGLKEAIMRRTRARKVFYPGRLAGEMGLSYDTVMEAVLSLEREGRLRAVGDE